MLLLGSCRVLGTLFVQTHFGLEMWSVHPIDEFFMHILHRAAVAHLVHTVFRYSVARKTSIIVILFYLFVAIDTTVALRRETHGCKFRVDVLPST